MLENIDDRLKFLLGLTAAATAKYLATWWLREKRQDRFELVGTVKELICYPVKSCKGVYVDEAECTKFGLKVDGVFDRHWMVTRDNGRFLSQRQEPKMALITVKVTESGVELSAPGMSPCQLSRDIQKTRNNISKCTVWDCNTQGLDCGDAAGQWVSQYLGKPGLRVMFYSHDLEKRTFINETKPWFTRTLETDYCGYADWATYLFLTTSSLEALNKHLKKPLTMKSFRPNIVIDGTDAFEEDDWEEIIIGDKVQMRCLSACDRCVLTTVDPEKGVKSEDGEPLKTLKRIRSIPPYDKYNECVFGINAAPDVCGTVQVGDPVYAIRKLQQ
ncbi:mitochondrial amidoxime reducing component 2-like isoform X1 [Mercenaria mercenaria]|uniref:mitochondrial amidoxime reducing component 2-like isoform X1 n=1 Tax=Mercenaria mercenaria TaxID=6596 RepID=UPI00234EA3EA|nr:mitochondrial amidoxime reducing component 2-like isoform X1 [Mercenaria mercenaria]